MPRRSEAHERLPGPQPARTSGARRLTIDGQTWVVREVTEAKLDRRAASHLLFEGPHGARCVRSYPPDWRMLSDEDLFRLSVNFRRPLRSG